MSYSIISTKHFEKELKRVTKKFPSLKNEFAKLILDLKTNPDLGILIGNNCLKCGEYKQKLINLFKEKLKLTQSDTAHMETIAEVLKVVHNQKI